jgi:hypothetical protein
MASDVLILEYAERKPRRRFVRAAARWLERWLERSIMLAAGGLIAPGRFCWRNRHQLIGLAGAAVALWVVMTALDARVVLSTPQYGGCGADRSHARANLFFAGLGLCSLPLFWLGARRSLWASRVARTSAIIALLWWAYMSYPGNGPRLFMPAFAARAHTP